MIRRLEHLTGNHDRPQLGYGVETRERPGPLHKHGAFEDDVVWLQLHGGLVVAKAQVQITWLGEYSDVRQIRDRTRGAPIHLVEDFWKGRDRYGYAGVATLRRELWVEPFWAGPRTYGYEWVRLEDEKKRASWLDPKPAPRGTDALRGQFRAWLAAH
jgi:hypothetical protein